MDEPYEDRLATALRGVGVIAGQEQVDAITGAIRAIVADELASLGGHLLGHFGDPGTLTSAADPQREALSSLGGFLLEHFGRED